MAPTGNPRISRAIVLPVVVLGLGLFWTWLGMLIARLF
jgi:hypothetical protein